ncbi:MAG TPA: hypothetical protein DD435_16570 [Cyanobacteria bacterium UBA8530]|nr:hypothetical protein [Cyanobacteria bacterium UBA8530]
MEKIVKLLSFIAVCQGILILGLSFALYFGWQATDHQLALLRERSRAFEQRQDVLARAMTSDSEKALRELALLKKQRAGLSKTFNLDQAYLMFQISLDQSFLLSEHLFRSQIELAKSLEKKR